MTTSDSCAGRKSLRLLKMKGKIVGEVDKKQVIEEMKSSSFDDSDGVRHNKQQENGAGQGVDNMQEEVLDHKDVSLVWQYMGGCDDEYTGPRKIYVGSEKFSRFRKGLDKFGISVIVNCTIGSPNKFSESGDIRYHKVRLSDDRDQEIVTKLPSATKFINEVGKCNNVLIHCSKGVSRSVAVFISWLIQYQRYTLKDALHWIKGKRTLADPNDGFLHQLLDWERTHHPNSPSLTKEDFLPCPVCLLVRYETSTSFACGHRCCSICKEKAPPNEACAHCTYAAASSGDTRGHASSSISKSDSLEDLTDFANTMVIQSKTCDIIETD